MTDIIYLIIFIWIVKEMALPRRNNVMDPVLATQPVKSTLPQADGLQHCEGGGVRLGLSQAAASLFTESGSVFPRLALVESFVAGLSVL